MQWEDICCVPNCLLGFLADHNGKYQQTSSGEDLLVRNTFFFGQLVVTKPKLMLRKRSKEKRFLCLNKRTIYANNTIPFRWENLFFFKNDLIWMSSYHTKNVVSFFQRHVSKHHPFKPDGSLFFIFFFSSKKHPSSSWEVEIKSKESPHQDSCTCSCLFHFGDIMFIVDPLSSWKFKVLLFLLTINYCLVIWATTMINIRSTQYLFDAWNKSYLLMKLHSAQNVPWNTQQHMLNLTILSQKPLLCKMNILWRDFPQAKNNLGCAETPAISPSCKCQPTCLTMLDNW